MSLYRLKPRFQALLRPLAAALHRWGVSANVVTLAAGLLSIALGLVLLIDPQARLWWALLPLWLLLRMALNAIDGLLAREYAQATPLGVYLNELTDVLADIALYAPFVLLPDSHRTLGGAMLFAFVVVEMSGVLGHAVGAGRRNEGPFGKSDRALAFGLLGLLFAAGLTPGNWLNALWVGLLLLSVFTIGIRLRAGIVAAAGKPL